MNRRDFLKTSGALVVSFSSTRLGEAVVLGQGPFDTRASHIDPNLLDSWIAVGTDGLITAYTGKCELGQGILTAQVQLVAEELSVPVERVHVIQCDTASCPDQGTTSGSQSTPTNFNERNLGQAAATARQALLRLASERMSLPVDQLIARDGAVVANSDSSRRVTYAELVGGRTLNVRVDAAAPRKSPSEWTTRGRAVPRVDMVAMATGQFEFVHNVRVPGMLHGAVVRPPSTNATLEHADESSVQSLPGFVALVIRNNFVGIVAEKPWQAAQAAKQLKATWSAGPELPPDEHFYEWMRRQPSRDAYIVKSADVDAKLRSAARVLKSTYVHPYQMHGSIGTSCAVADVSNGSATVWSPTQSAYPTRSGVALVLGIPVDKVRVIFTRGAGCYGINGADTVSYDAAVLSQAVGKPVRVQLSRKDEMAWENYGTAYVIDQRIGVDAGGTIVAWDYEAWLPTRGGRPGYDRPGNVVTGMLLGHDAVPFSPQTARAPSGGFRNNSNAAPSYVAGRVSNKSEGAGVVTGERVLTHTIASPFFTGPLRSPSRLQNTFAHECFLDEVAASIGADPLAYRLRHLRDERLKDVVSAAAKAAKWSARPSPRRDAPASGIASGRGMSCVVYEGDNGYVAMVAEVDVNRTTGQVTARRFFVAQDCGPISNPDGMRNQIEGGTLQGLSRALGEEVTWDEHGVTSVDWRSYHSLPLGIEVPTIESVLIDRRDAEATGAGETAITLVAAAVGNAIFDATGARIREVPFTPQRVQAALAAH
ncbi:MAG TPA: molybdopterin cofactor-binding domain-containing protein [Vicinamibacterales bacterium]|jgi:CO/xanthine dehydrogenase Mo-binding subunit